MRLHDLLVGEELENFDHARRPIKASERTAGEVPYLGASGVVDSVSGFTHEGDFLCVSEDGENLRSRKTPIAWVQRGQFWANNHLHVLGGLPLARLRFYAAALNQANIASYLTGSAQPKLSQQSLNAITLPRFTENEQTAIGQVLGALDDKIGVNQRTQDCSRDLARTLVELEPRTCLLADLAAASGSPTPPEQMDAKFVTHFSLPAFDQGFATVERPEEIKSSKFALNAPVVLVSKLNPRIPRIWPIDILPDGLSVTSTEFVPLAPRDGVSVGELWATLQSPRFTEQVLAHVAGTTGSHQRVRPSDLLRVSVADVRAIPVEIRQLLQDLCRLTNERTTENQRLTATRDQFLPLLLSGKITIKDADMRADQVV